MTQKELKERYDAMVKVLADLFDCGPLDVKELFDPKNGIKVGEITKEYVEECGCLPSFNSIYYEAMLDFASEHKLEFGVDVDIYINSSLDTHIYARKGLDDRLKEEMEDLFQMKVETLMPKCV